ncbi:MAG: 50S ribosomal protein L25/general stress protein Ctc [Pseudomonadota bacterium]
MSDQFEISAQLREDIGKGASRRLRRQADHIPAIIYGAGEDPQPLTLVRKDFEKALENEAFYSHVLTIHVGKDRQKAILKDLQRHPAKDRVLHADFLRVDDKVAIKVNVPIHFLNEESCVGVKMQGGLVQHQATDIEVQCLPGDIPAFIEVDMQEVEVGQIVHLSDITLPEGVNSVALSLGEDHDLAIASVNAPRGGDLEDDLQDATGEEGAEESSDGAADGEGADDSGED